MKVFCPFLVKICVVVEKDGVGVSGWGDVNYLTWKMGLRQYERDQFSLSKMEDHVGRPIPDELCFGGATKRKICAAQREEPRESLLSGYDV